MSSVVLMLGEFCFVLSLLLLLFTIFYLQKNRHQIDVIL